MEGMMRATIAAIAVLAVLALDQPGFAQGIQSPSVTPKQPVARKQPRPADVTPMPPPRPAAPMPSATQTDDDADARMNRALNSICRGC
jgi:negative regulator of sigma E activity